MAEANVEVAKAQLDLWKAQAAKAEVEKKVLELNYKYKALLMKQQRGSIVKKPPNSSRPICHK